MDRYIKTPRNLISLWKQLTNTSLTGTSTQRLSTNRASTGFHPRGAEPLQPRPDPPPSRKEDAPKEEFEECPRTRRNILRDVKKTAMYTPFHGVYKVTLIYKSGEKTDPQNFRMIAIADVIGKVYHLILAERSRRGEGSSRPGLRYVW